MTDTRENFDAAIVGAGPAGSSLAIRLARSGLNVLLVEKSEFPREKLCGEFVSPECLDILAELDIEPAVGTRIEKTVFYTSSGRSVEIDSEWFGGTSRTALGVSRAVLDAELLEMCRVAGVDVRTRTSALPTLDGSSRIAGLRLKSDGGESELDAKLYIDATGRSRVLARKFLTSTELPRSATHVAFKTHLRGDAVEHATCEIYSYPGGYGGCNGVEDGQSNLCFIVSADQVKQNASDPNRVVQNVVCSNKRAGIVLENAAAKKEWLAVPIERFGPAPLIPCEGVITIGDAAAFIDPFTGSGILMALESAAIAAEAIRSGFVSGFDFNTVAVDYSRRHHRRFSTRLRVCSLLRAAAFSPVAASGLIQALRLSGGIRKRIAKATRHR